MRLLFFCALLLPAALQAQDSQPNSEGRESQATQESVDNNYSRLVFEAEWLPMPTASAAEAAPVNATINAAANAATNAANAAAATVSASAAAVTTSAAGATGTSVTGAGPGNSNGATAQADPAAINRYEDNISATAETEGLYADELREQYQSLGELYQQNNEHERAITAFENAMHIDRVNDGLFTLRQLPLVENIIESYTALGNTEEVNDHQAYLYYVSQRAYPADDPRLLAAKENWADWNVESYLQEGVTDSGRFDPMGLSRSDTSIDGGYVAVQNPNNGTFVYVPRRRIPDILAESTNPYAGGFGAATTGRALYERSATYAVPAEQIVDRRLRTARELYEEIATTTNEEYLAERGTLVEHKLANVAYATKQQIDALEDSIDDTGSLFNRNSPSSNPLIARGYGENRDALEAIARKLDDDATSDPLAVARAYINVGDWHFGFDRTQRGRESYERALAVLAEANIPATEIGSIFNPSPLIPVPGFALHPYSREFYGMAPDAELAFNGFIDMTLSINQNGDVRSSRITAVSENTPQRIRNVLLDFLRGNRMRPLVQDGKLMKESELSLRIHYSF